MPVTAKWIYHRFSLALDLTSFTVQCRRGQDRLPVYLQPQLNDQKHVVVIVPEGRSTVFVQGMTGKGTG
jgi:hypothetical protein